MGSVWYPKLCITGAQGPSELYATPLLTKQGMTAILELQEALSIVASTSFRLLCLAL